MKTVYMPTTIVLALFMLFFPLVSTAEPKAVEVGTAPIEYEKETPIVSEKTGVTEIRVYMSEQKKVETIKTEDYIFGVVAAEMPALYENEALKAQAVAAYTYAIHKIENSNNKDYDITDSYKTDQAFITVSEAREKWGSNAEEYETKIRSAVESVLYEKLTYNGKTILAAYHAISSGVTENATESWGDSYPYLCSVQSVGDKLSPNYLSTAEFTVEEIKSKLGSLTTFSGSESGYFKNAEKTSTGAVKSIEICGKKVSGSDVRAALELRSPTFEVKYSNGKYIFSVQGYGHGLGMSQYGAHYMALQGSNYKEILLHYYTDCKLE